MKKIHIGIVCDQFGNFDRGGAEVQIDNTIAALNKIEGISTEIVTSYTSDLARFDLFHFFKSSIEYSRFASLLTKNNIPYVVSTIIFPENYIIDLFKYFVGRNIPVVNKLSWMKFQYSLWDNAAMIYPNTDKELKFLRDIGVKTKADIIPNGLIIEEMEKTADIDKFYSYFPFLKNEKFVLNVARIDKRKNQSKLVQACKELDISLVIIGNKLDPVEFEKIEQINYQKLYYLGPIYDKSILFGAYKACSVFCLPSTMETPGIAALEAAYFNKPIVITKYGGTDYYFKDNAYYIDWRKTEEIKRGIIHMLKQNQCDTQELIKQYSWSNIAELYVKHYSDILLAHTTNK